MLFETALTEEQEKILRTSGDLLVIAGPGTGKTYTLLRKIKTLIEQGISPYKIYLLTFSFRTSQELKEKALELGLEGIKIDTFHGLAYDLYREYYQKEPLLISEKEKLFILKKLFPKEKNPLKDSEKKKEYFQYLKKNHILDFDLLLMEVASFIKPEAFLNYHFLIDEFQDLSPEILEFLKPFKSASWILFGDPNQSIYGFRGVDLKKIKDFLLNYKPQMKILTLRESFRCATEIIKAANNFRVSPWQIPELKAKKFGGSILGFLFPETFEERDFLGNFIKNLLGGITLERARLSALSPSDIFILSRIKKVYEPFIEHLQKEGIPVALPEEEALVIKDQLLQLVEKVKIFKIPFEKLLEETSTFLKNYLQNLATLFKEDLSKFLFYLDNLSPEDLTFPKLEGINFLTIHASKGLEAEVVILYGAEEGLIPFTLFNDYDFEEEKRILYVAITRAKNHFYFTATKNRKVFNFDLQKGLSTWLKEFPYKEFQKKPQRPKQRGLF
jgi:superfamily I DNA/RNA helicase